MAVKTRASMFRKKRNDIIFYALMAAIPITQFVIFYVAVNINSFVLAFKEYDSASRGYIWVNFANFKRVINDLIKNPDFLLTAKNSLTAYSFRLLIGLPCALFFSYYIFKKLPFSATFKVFLFMPSIISSIIMITLFRFFVDRAVPSFSNILFGKKIMGLIENPKTIFATVIFYNIWVSFGTNILLYVGAMGNISGSILEAAEMDGISTVQEFIFIIIPMVMSTINTFLVVGVATIFTDQLGLFSFFGADADTTSIQTFGYYLYKSVYTSNITNYPYLSAMGLVLTFVAVPITYCAKFLLEKIDPLNR